MNPVLKTMLEGWLKTGDEQQRKHAAARLAIGDSPPPPESDADRAARLIFEHPPDRDVRLGGCCG